MSLIEFKGITKYYKATKALDNINMTIEANKIYGLLGRNGAGKTTLLNLLTSKIFPSEGDITVDGDSVFENDEALRNIFYMMEKNLYPEHLRVNELFRWTKEYYPSFDVEYAKSLAEKFKLNTKKRVKELSTGYASITKAIIALATNAGILIFDEPVLGLDANHRELFYRELLANYSENPKTIIISTHLIEEIGDVLEEVIIIKEGQLLEKRSIEELLVSVYTVSGEGSKVDTYLKDKKYIGVNELGKFKAAIVYEEMKPKAAAEAKELGLELSRVELQKLFISLTNS